MRLIQLLATALVTRAVYNLDGASRINFESLYYSGNGHTFVVGSFTSGAAVDTTPGVTFLGVSGGKDLFLEEYDLEGELVQQILFGGTRNEVEPTMSIDDVSGYLVVAAKTDSGPSSNLWFTDCDDNKDYVVVLTFRLDSSQAVPLWGRCTVHKVTVLSVVAFTYDGNKLVCTLESPETSRLTGDNSNLYPYYVTYNDDEPLTEFTALPQLTCPSVNGNCYNSESYIGFNGELRVFVVSRTNTNGNSVLIWTVTTAAATLIVGPQSDSLDGVACKSGVCTMFGTSKSSYSGCVAVSSAQAFIMSLTSNADVQVSTCSRLQLNVIKSVYHMGSDGYLYTGSIASNWYIGQLKQAIQTNYPISLTIGDSFIGIGAANMNGKAILGTNTIGFAVFIVNYIPVATSSKTTSTSTRTSRTSISSVTTITQTSTYISLSLPTSSTTTASFTTYMGQSGISLYLSSISSAKTTSSMVSSMQILTSALGTTTTNSVSSSVVKSSSASKTSTSSHQLLSTISNSQQLSAVSQSMSLTYIGQSQELHTTVATSTQLLIVESLTEAQLIMSSQQQSTRYKSDEVVELTFKPVTAHITQPQVDQVSTTDNSKYYQSNSQNQSILAIVIILLCVGFVIVLFTCYYCQSKRFKKSRAMELYGLGTNSNTQLLAASSTKEIQDLVNSQKQGLHQLGLYRYDKETVMKDIATSYTEFGHSTTIFEPNTRELSIPGFLLLSPGDDYVITGNLTEGGYATIMLCKLKNKEAIQRNGSNICVIKITKPTQKKTAEQKSDEAATFLQEVSVMQYFSSVPNFVKLVGYSTQPYSILMKYYPYGVLYDVLFSQQSRVPYSSQLMLSFLKDVCKALYEMHRSGIVHYDIKEANILIDATANLQVPFQAVLTDFGVSKIVSNQVTQVSGFVMAKLNGVSIDYAAPEYLQAGIQGFRVSEIKPELQYKVDVYALAIVAYEMFTRKHAWLSTTLKATLVNQIIEGKRPVFPDQSPLEDFSNVMKRGSMTMQIKKLIMDMWQQNPILRPTMAEIIIRIQAIEQVKPEIV